MVTLLVHNHIDGEDHTSGATIEPHWTYRSQQSTNEPQQPHQSSEFFYWNRTSSSTCKTCQKIESGAFVDMVELLPERLDTADSEDAKLKKKKGRSPYWNGFNAMPPMSLWWPEDNLLAWLTSWGPVQGGYKKCLSTNSRSILLTGTC